MDILTTLNIIYFVIGILVGIPVLLSYIPKVNKFLNRNKHFKKILPIFKFIIIFIGIFFLVFLFFGKIEFVHEMNSNKIYSLTDPSCLENSMLPNIIDFEWIIQSEENFNTRIAYYIIPYSSGNYHRIPFFNKNWEDIKIGIESSTIQNQVNYSDAQRGRYKICAQIVNKLNNEEVLETNCCTTNIDSN